MADTLFVIIPQSLVCTGVSPVGIILSDSWKMGKGESLYCFLFCLIAGLGVVFGTGIGFSQIVLGMGTYWDYRMDLF